jgi:hypothetical protein
VDVPVGARAGLESDPGHPHVGAVGDLDVAREIVLEVAAPTAAALLLLRRADRHDHRGRNERQQDSGS